MKARVMAAMSGGVDSAVAAFLLKDQGFKVTGVTMCLGVEVNETGKIRCCGPQEIEEARRVCESLGISHYVLDFAPDLKDFVIDPFLRVRHGQDTESPHRVQQTHQVRLTPQESIGHGIRLPCNRSLCRDTRSNGNYRLVMPKDNRKDQTYFLSGIPRNALEHVHFPCRTSLRMR